MTRRLTQIVVTLMFLAVAASPTLAQTCDGIAPLNNTSLNGITVVSGVFDPVAVRSAPGDPDRLFVVQRNGIIRVHQRGDAPGVTSVYMDIDSRVDSASFNEMGLLGLAFHPDFQNNKLFYVNYTNNSGTTIVSRFTEVGGVGSSTSEKLVLSVGQPEANHNGGDIHFGPDGYLYIATGDGGGGGDAHGACGNGQNTGNLLGKILRVDINGTSPNSPDCSSGSYTIPDNDLADGAGGDCDEIFAYGLRNPWRFSFDSENGDMYIGDVGQGCWEEVNWTTLADTNGANFGWRQMEGAHCYNPGGGCNPANANGCSPNCFDPSLTLPIHETDSTGECTVIGGFNYRGCRMPNFHNKYFWGDYCAAYIKSFEVAGGLKTNEETWTSQVEVGTSLNSSDLSSFGTDIEGELYYTDRDGTVVLITAPFVDFQVSAQGVADAEQFLLDDNNWTWQDLQYSSQYQISDYHVYRSDAPDGIFDCINAASSTSWTGDLTLPALGSGFYYFVVAEEAASGTLSGAGGTRTLGAGCP